MKNLSIHLLYIPICIGKCQHLKVRKNVYRLTQVEKEDLTNAMLRLIESNEEWRNFQDIANFHGAPYIICRDSAGNHEACCPHQRGSTDFLIWHRYYDVMLIIL